jgi:CYTH domain-containing protein
MTMRRGEDEALHPKYAHIERERRWIVDQSAHLALDALPHILIEDRYIDCTRLRLRRMTDSVTGDVALKLTKKYEAGDPLARPIVTAYLNDGEYEAFAALPARSLIKRRFHIPVEDREFSVDQFCGNLAGLELVEIEWPDDEGLRAIVPPLWAGREVSADAAYQGGTLATRGKPKD